MTSPTNYLIKCRCQWRCCLTLSFVVRERVHLFAAGRRKAAAEAAAEAAAGDLAFTLSNKHGLELRHVPFRYIRCIFSDIFIHIFCLIRCFLRLKIFKSVTRLATTLDCHTMKSRRRMLSFSLFLCLYSMNALPGNEMLILQESVLSSTEVIQSVHFKV